MKKIFKCVLILMCFVFTAAVIVTFFDTKDREKVAGTYEYVYIEDEGYCGKSYITLFSNGEGYIYEDYICTVGQRTDTVKGISQYIHDWKYDVSKQSIVCKIMDDIDTIKVKNNSLILHDVLKYKKSNYTPISLDEFENIIIAEKEKYEYDKKMEKYKINAYVFSKQYVETYLKDPNSLEVISHNETYDKNNQTFVVYIDFTAKNQYNGRVRNSLWVKLKPISPKEFNFEVLSYSFQ